LSSDAPIPDQFTSALDELDRGDAQIIIRMEMRKRRKPVTLVEGIPERTNRDQLERIAAELKKKLATGGTAKDSVILLQGDQRDKAKDELVRLGYPEERIEVY
jgi:translation initiation factor 1